MSHQMVIKSTVVLMNVLHDLRGDAPCHVTLMASHSRMSLQYDARIGIQSIRSFHPVLSKKTLKKVSSSSGNTMDIALY